MRKYHPEDIHRFLEKACVWPVFTTDKDGRTTCELKETSFGDVLEGTRGNMEKGTQDRSSDYITNLMKVCSMLGLQAGKRALALFSPLAGDVEITDLQAYIGGKDPEMERIHNSHQEILINMAALQQSDPDYDEKREEYKNTAAQLAEEGHTLKPRHERMMKIIEGYGFSEEAEQYLRSAASWDAACTDVILSMGLLRHIHSSLAGMAAMMPAAREERETHGRQGRNLTGNSFLKDQFSTLKENQHGLPDVLEKLGELPIVKYERPPSSYTPLEAENYATIREGMTEAIKTLSRIDNDLSTLMNPPRRRM